MRRVIRPKVPRGVGTFVRNLKADGKPNAVEFAERAERIGLGWVALLGETFNDGMATGVYDKDLPEYAAELRKRGIQVWVWGWPTPADQDKFVADLARQVERTQAEGVIIDAEGPYTGNRQDRRDAARELGRAFKRKGITFGVTSFGGGPAIFGRNAFPWNEFAEHAAFGMPQIYDPRTGDRARKMLATWTEDTPFPVIIPILDANNEPTVMRGWWAALRNPKTVGWWTHDYVTGNKAKEGIIREISGKGAALA